LSSAPDKIIELLGELASQGKIKQASNGDWVLTD
jgi:hypothetical protein